MTGDKPKRVFLCGIGGSGMSALALILLHQGCEVRGSDRSCDLGETPEKFDQLRRTGIEIVPQDGKGLDSSFDLLIVSSAIEESIPDVRAARAHAIPVQKRADILAENFNAGHGIAIGGTSGKSTVTAMLGHILSQTGRDPTVINGAAMVNALEEGADGLGNAVIGKGAPFVIEADESDGSIVLYRPEIAVLTNISLDHKPIDITRPLFETFLQNAKKTAVINLDNPEAAALTGLHPQTVTFSLQNPAATFVAEDIQLQPDGTSFRVRHTPSGKTFAAQLQVPGKHNVENAMASIAAACLSGLSLEEAVFPLADFRGVKRRLEYLGTENGITVIDDFGHNPDKVAASLAALKQAEGRLIVVFQPHGFEPMRLMGQDITQAFADGLGQDDILVMSEILYKGGTVRRDISSGDFIGIVAENGRTALFLPEREQIMDYLLKTAKPGDRVIIMGARDDSLTDFGHEFLKRQRNSSAQKGPASILPPDPPQP